MADLITRQRGTIKVGDLHPGAAVVLRRFRMNETEVAQAIRDGELASPQQFENVWLFRLRITGTGTAYRPKHEEHVYRPPEDYLNDEFLQRCLGLPVVLEHPKKQVLDSQEFADRIIGTIVLSWIEADEVWGIAKVYDQNAARYMIKHQLSTSPAVVFRYKDETEKVATPDGKHLLIEGKPSLLDHLAICEEGVWDKGGPPSGVDVSGATTRSDSMADEKDKDEREHDEQRADAAAGEKLDKLLKGIDSLHGRMDALSSRMDAYDDHARDDKSRDDRKRDDKRRDDRRADADEDKAELERRQAKDLRQLAEEEEDEAEDKERGDKARDDAEDEDEKKKEEDEERDDRRRDDNEDDEDEEEEEEKEAASARDDRRRDDRKRDDRRLDDRKRDDRRRDDRARDDRHVRDDRRRDDRRRDDNVDEGFKESATEHEHIRHDSKVARLERDIDILKRRTANRSDEEEAAFADAQARADEVYASHGKHAPRPMAGETLTGYRIRLARALQPHSPAWKDSDLLAIARSDATAFNNIEGLIYADAAQEGRNPTTVPLGSLREVHKRGPGGREIIEFVGDPLSWMSPFMAPGAAAQRLGIRRQ